MPMLHVMDDSVFQLVKQELIDRYANDQIICGRWTSVSATEHAAIELDRLLPDGPATPSHFLYVIKRPDEREAVGRLWFSISARANTKEAFLCDIYINPGQRRRGHARQALAEFESLARQLGASSIGLHAFSHNAEAISLYEALGFRTTSVNMHCQLGDACAEHT
jgi:ribosomal protein S18 acetylase RimI-like enzyme